MDSRKLLELWGFGTLLRSLHCLLVAFSVLGAVPPVQNSEYRVADYRGGKAAALSVTFDDNTADQFTSGQPMLDQRGIRATFFIIVSTVSNSSSVTWATLDEAAKKGHEIGNHGMTHTNLSGVTDTNALLQNLCVARDTINSRLTDSKCITHAWAFGGSNETARRIAGRCFVAARNAGTSIIKAPDGYFLTVADYMNGVPESMLDTIIHRKAWVVELFHAVPSGFAAHLDAPKSRETSIWYAPFGDVARYVKERMCATVVKQSQTDTALTLSLTDTLSNNDLYDYPLTLSISLPSTWSSATAKQDGKVLDAQVAAGRALFDAVPDRGEIVLAKAAGVTTRHVRRSPKGGAVVGSKRPEMRGCGMRRSSPVGSVDMGGRCIHPARDRQRARDEFR